MPTSVVRNTAPHAQPDSPAAAHPVPDRQGGSLLGADPELRALLPLYLPADLFNHLLPHLERMGALAGGVLDELAAVADQNPPTLSYRTRSGMDAQRIDKHPAYVEMERVAFAEFGLAAASHRGGVLGWDKPMPPAAKYALTYLFVQAEFGLCCPLSMTDSLTRTLRKFGDPALVGKFLPNLTTQVFEDLYQGAMFMTEQGAGSDVAATATRAVRDTGAEGGWRLHGDKWFCSNPDAALAMVLARVEDEAGNAVPGHKGVSLFLLPRKLADGSDNQYRIIRLKDKLGTRSMASGEIRLEGAQAYLVGEPGRGFVQMADMINNSRLSNGVRAAGLMRRALTEGLFIAHERRAFGKRLEDMPLMRRQLLKLTLPTEQARTMVFQTAEALRRADAGEADAYPLMRILTPLIKFRACRDARKVTGDAMEIRGGCGYIEEWSDPRLVRDAHLGSIWEGTSNIVALDVLRAIRREGALPVLQAHLAGLLADTPMHADAHATFEGAIAAAAKLAAHAAEAGADGDLLARQAASALYHVTTAVAMAWEAGRIGSVRRMRLAQLVLRHRVLPQDPLAASTEPDWLAETVAPPADGVVRAAGAVADVNVF
ncbi:acyl-CoA dehydrogenase family protein [Cupriavidus sp. IK-TO18]|uniref:acyl-CoA dehydrogenase family protein n=1 Tax=Cupriavidus sp. IK-TO18 TaxID=2782182 RepID=UPI0018982849|nr:acyl-CoA dehydrogenase family protein [Cupriavidus sp. IK-TO18]MBF6988510.1 acyl-CoA dehydrogenase family protein [Cupriavidus sp. IK-TO18]